MYYFYLVKTAKREGVRGVEEKRTSRKKNHAFERFEFVLLYVTACCMHAYVKTIFNNNVYYIRFENAMFNLYVSIVFERK